MRKNLTWLVVIGSIAVIGSAWAFDGGKIRANVPFEFYVGTELLPAGEYQFEMRSLGRGSATASNVVVSNSEGTLLAMRMTIPGIADPEKAQLHFNRYGSTNFLTKVEGMGLQAQISTTSAERTLMARGNRAVQETLAASR